MSSALDFRSDTVTRPTAVMREAMAAAEVGDDVLDGDPTLMRLEARVADLLGQEAALWTPSGCMANLIALMLHLKRGDGFFAPAQSHVLGSELGTGAWLAGGMPQALPWDGGPGWPSPETVRRAAGSPGPYYTLQSRLLCLENTHNFAGGTVIPKAEWNALVAVAQSSGLRVHLDGARVWHAAAAQGSAVSDLCAGADTVQVCLSKGLGAPMGSCFAGSRHAVQEARRIRKMLGGGVRQGGVVGAAGLAALDELPRIAEDHAKARTLAAGLRALGFTLAEPETNILLVEVRDTGQSMALLEGVGVRALPVGSRLRFITHRDLAEADVVLALDRIATVAGRMLEAG